MTSYESSHIDINEEFEVTLGAAIARARWGPAANFFLFFFRSDGCKTQTGASFFVPAIGISMCLRNAHKKVSRSILALGSFALTILNSNHCYTIYLSTHPISTMSVTDETKAIAPEAAAAPAEAEPTKEVEKAAADAPVEEKKEEETTKVSLSRRWRAIPQQTMCTVIVLLYYRINLWVN